MSRRYLQSLFPRPFHSRPFSARPTPVPIPSASPSAPPTKFNYKAHATDFRLLAFIFSTLFLGGGYYIYDYYQMYKTWPKEVRDLLRQAIKSSDNQDWIRSEKAYGNAYTAARSIDPPLPLLHTTGISIALSHLLLTRLFAPQRAYPVLQTALSDLDNAPEPLTPKERQRRIGVLYKLAEVAEKLRRDGDEERWLTRAVEEGLRAVVERRKEVREEVEESKVEVQEVPMPSWLSKADLGACLDKLGEFYLKKGQADYAAPLYLHAINTVLPPTTPGEESKDHLVSTEDQCRAAMMMNNLSNTLTLNPTTTNLTAAVTWAEKSLGTLQTVWKTAPEFSNKDAGLDEEGQKRREMCELVKGVALFNLGVLKEMNKEYDLAKGSLREAMEHSQSTGFRAGVQQAQDALRRIKQAEEETAAAVEKGGKRFW